MNKKDIDFASDKESASPDDLKKITEKADKAAALKKRISKGELLLADLKGKVRVIEDEELPEMMKACGVETFTTTQGINITIKDILAGSIPAAGAIRKASGEDREELEQRRDACLQYIKSHGGEDIINSSAEVDIGKDPKLRAKVNKALEKAGFSYRIDDSVHHQTLNSWLKEKLASGENIPHETFKIFQGERAIIKIPRL